MMARVAAARFGFPVVVVVAVLAAGGVRLVAEARAELEASDAAWAKGDGVGAVAHARSAARAYVPGAAHMAFGFQRLRDIAETSERKGDAETALFAWRAITSAAVGSRPFSAACGESCDAAEDAVARLSAAARASARQGSSGGGGPGRESSPASADMVPRVGWGVLLLAGAALWLAAGLRLTSRAWGSDGHLSPAQVRLAAAMAAAGLLAWLAGLLMA